MVRAMADILSWDNPVVGAYLFFSSLLVLKMMFMSLLTGLQRHRTKSFANPEDAKAMNVEVRINENVERVRRAHMNDLENIPIFIISALVYTLSDPSELAAKILFLLFTIARFAHTFVYAVVVIPQPARGLSWGTGYLITGYMAITGLIKFWPL